MDRPKVFGIGFHKTGTTSLALALRALDYRVAGPFGTTDPDIAATAVDQAIRIAQDFDAAQDNPWAVLFRELDEAYPGSRFVMTVRDTEKWLSSAVRHFGGDSTPMREWIYGVGDPIGAEDVYRRRYEQHIDDVLDHFKSRPGDLLVLRIDQGEGWPELCSFLGIDGPNVPFPHANSHESRTSSRVVRSLRKLGRLASRTLKSRD